MQARIRQQVGALCRTKQAEFTPHFGTPSTLAFGQSAFIGTAATRIDGLDVPLIARLDHQHGMPASPQAFIDALDTQCFYIHDFILASGTPAGVITYADGASGFNFDHPADVLGQQINDPGDFGHLGQSTGGGAPPRVAGWLIGPGTFTTANETTKARTLFDRMVQFETKGRLVDVADAAGDMTTFARGAMVYVGGMITATNRRPDSATDGLFFRIAFPNTAQGLERWEAVSVSSATGQTTVKDTGVKVEYIPKSGQLRASHQVLEIDFNGTDTAYFYINGGLVATIDTNLPLGKRLAGWGVFGVTQVAAPTLTFNSLASAYGRYLGRRTA